MTLPPPERSSRDVERRLADILLAEADTVVPSGEGLTRIRERIDRRRNRLRWLRPTLAVSTAAALGVGGVLALNLTHGTTDTLRSDHQRPAIGGPSPTSVPSLPSSPSASPSPAPTPAGRPAVALPPYPAWPFTSIRQVRAWQAQGGPAHQPQLLDPGTTATAFADFLAVPGLRVLDVADEPGGGGKAVTLGRQMADGAVHGVTVVHVARYGAGAGTPWVVTRAGAYHLKITSPGLAAALSSPVSVAAEVDGVHHSIGFALWRRTQATALAGPTYAMGGAAAGPRTTLSYTLPKAAAGMVVASEQSAAGDGILALAMVPVRLSAASGAPGGPVARPAKNGDVDGDGQEDQAAIEPGTSGGSTLVVGLSAGGEQRISLATDASAKPRIIGIEDADRDGYGEIFVVVGHGAATELTEVVRLVDGGLRLVTQSGSPLRLVSGGSATHLDSWGCTAGSLFTWSGRSADGVNYPGTQSTLRFSGSTVTTVSTKDVTVDATHPAPSGCGLLQY